jgi:hypothetical protein
MKSTIQSITLVGAIVVMVLCLIELRKDKQCNPVIESTLITTPCDSFLGYSKNGVSNEKAD